MERKDSKEKKEGMTENINGKIREGEGEENMLKNEGGKIGGKRKGGKQRRRGIECEEM